MFIVGGNQSSGGYAVDNSVRLDTNTTFTRTLGASPTNAKKGTISFWFKKVETPNSNNYGRFVHIGSTSNDFSLYTIYDTIAWYINAGTNGSGLTTGRKYRDQSAWYHLIFSLDSTLGTAIDRIKLYVNGELQDSSSFPQNSNVTLNTDIFDASHLFCIGATNSTSLAQNLDGYISEFVYVDGTALDETSFGEFDEDTGIWKPIDVSGLTFGTNGFYLDFEDSAALGDDVSGNGNDLTANNLTAVDQSTDTPTNNFPTGNSLVPTTLTYSDGNNTISHGADWKASPATIAVTQGKWYAEMKLVSTSFGATFGVEDMDLVSTWSAVLVGTSVNGRGYYSSDGTSYNGGSPSAFGATYTSGDIVGIALDMDNKFVYFSKNGVYQNSGVPTSGASGTGGLSLAGTTYAFAYGMYSSTSSLNFGNPPYTISSGNSDANGYGNFEYAVPSGYYALNTKNLAEYG